MSTSSLGTVEKQWVLGMNPLRSSFLGFVEEERILYPAASVIVIFHIGDRAQEFIQLSDLASPTALALFPNRQYVAVAETEETEGRQRPSRGINVYDLGALGRKRRLGPGQEDPKGAPFVSIAVSHSGKFLAAQSGYPQGKTFYWAWEKGKLMAWTEPFKVQSVEQRVMDSIQVVFNPMDDNVISLVGPGVFRCFRLTEGVLKSFGHTKNDRPDYYCHLWLTSERLVCGTTSGAISIFSHGDFKARIKVRSPDDPTPFPDSEEGLEEVEGALEVLAPSASTITSLVAVTNGFACSTSKGWAHLFQRLPEGDRAFYKQVHDIRLPGRRGVEGGRSEDDLPGIQSMSLSPSGDVLVAASVHRGLYSVSLPQVRVSRGVTWTFRTLLEPYHWGGVVDIDISLQRPLVVTCGDDRLVCVWNSRDMNLELSQEFSEEISCTAIHPLGLYLAAGLPEKLKLFGVHVGELEGLHEFPVRRCPDCAFSNGGHLLAAVSKSSIHIYSTTTYQRLTTLQAHISTVRAVIWSSNDGELVSCGDDGGIFQWEIPSGKRSSELVIKGCPIKDLTRDSKHIYAVDKNNRILQVSESLGLATELLVAELRIATECSLPGRWAHADWEEVGGLRYELDVKEEVECVRLTRDMSLMFLGTCRGRVRSIPFPISYTRMEVSEAPGHLAPVTKLCMLHDGVRMVSTSSDGTVIVWGIQEAESHLAPKSLDTFCSDHVLAHRFTLQDKEREAETLREEKDRMKESYEYALHLKDKGHQEQVEALQAQHANRLAALQLQIKALEETQAEKDRQKTEELESLRREVSSRLDASKEQERCHREQLREADEAHRRAAAEQQRLFREELEATRRRLEAEKQETANEYEEKLTDERARIQQMKAEREVERAEEREWRAQMEEEADREITLLRARFGEKLLLRADAIERLEGNLAETHKKLAQLEKTSGKLEGESQKWRVLFERSERINGEMERTAAALRQEIQTREDTIRKLESEVGMLRKRCLEAEKEREIARHKAEELAAAIPPKDLEIGRLRERNDKLEGDIVVMHNSMHRNKMALESTKGKLGVAMMEAERAREEEKREMMRMWKRISSLATVVGQPRRLREAVLDLMEAEKKNNLQ